MFNRELSRFEQGKKRIERLSHGTLEVFGKLLKYKGIKNRFDMYKKCFTGENKNSFSAFFERGLIGKEARYLYAIGDKINYYGVSTEFVELSRKHSNIKPSVKLICRFLFDKDNKLQMLTPYLYRWESM